MTWGTVCLFICDSNETVTRGSILELNTHRNQRPVHLITELSFLCFSCTESFSLDLRSFCKWCVCFSALAPSSTNWKHKRPHCEPSVWVLLWLLYKSSDLTACTMNHVVLKATKRTLLNTNSSISKSICIRTKTMHVHEIFRPPNMSLSNTINLRRAGRPCSSARGRKVDFTFSCGMKNQIKAAEMK